MNIGSIQVLVGGAGQPATDGGQVGDSSAFGSIFNTVVAGGPAAVTPVGDDTLGSTTNETMLAILNATTVEEIVTILEASKGEANDSLQGLTNDETVDLHAQKGFVFEFLKLPELEQLAGLLETDVEQLLESILPLLEKAGLSEGELDTVTYVNDFWSLLDIIDKVAPNFFAEMTTALEGKGAIPKEQAVDLLALLKSIEVAAPKTDLLMKQEQQVFSLQSLLAATAEKLDSTINTNQNRQSAIQLMSAQPIFRVIPEAQISTNHESLKDTPKETVQHTGTQTVTIKEEIRLAPTENSSNERNAALMREMQSIFNRSNFGQAGGTNRLLIKLYPEHLGQVRIELLQVNGVMTARILASTALGKEMLDSQLTQLRHAFVQQNIQVDRIDVSQTLQDTPRNDRDHAFNQHFRQEQEESNEHEEQNPEEELTFQEYMIELEA